MGKTTKIDWCDSSWNLVTGCEHGCPYCYARGIAERFKGWDDSPDGYRCILDGTETHSILELDSQPYRVRKDGKRVPAPYPLGFTPTLHRYRLDIPQGWEEPRTIFVCSMADLFGDWVPDSWIQDVFLACAQAPQHRYLFLTKNPARLLKMGQNRLLPSGESFWFGSTATTPSTPFFYSTDLNMNTFVSIEPILKPFGNGAPMGVQWVIIGAETGHRKGKVIPEKSWITDIVRQCREEGTPIFMKESLKTIMGEDFVQEFPWRTES